MKEISKMDIDFKYINDGRWDVAGVAFSILLKNGCPPNSKIKFSTITSEAGKPRLKAILLADEVNA